jgi:hypothetical protein
MMRQKAGLSRLDLRGGARYKVSMKKITHEGAKRFIHGYRCGLVDDFHFYVYTNIFRVLSKFDRRSEIGKNNY